MGENAKEDLAKRQKIFADTKNVIDTMFNSIQKDYDVMTMTLPEDKKDFVKKEVKAVSEKLEVVGRFKEKVDKIDEFVANLDNFDKTLKTVDSWMTQADSQLNDIKNNSDTMTPKDRGAQEYLQRKGEARGQPVIMLSILNYCYCHC